MPKLAVFVALILCLGFLCVEDQILATDALGTPHGAILKAYLVELLGPTAACLEIRKLGKLLWLELAKQDGCPNGRAFPGMHLAGQERLYYLIVGPCVITDDRGVPIRIGPAPSATPAVRMTIRSKRVQVLLDPSYGLGHLSGDRMKDSKPGLLTLGSTLAHENGHECGHQDASVLAELESNQCAIDAENRFNQAHGVDSIRQTH